MASPTRFRVKHLRLKGVAAAEVLAMLDAVCAAGASCPEVQGSPIGASTLAALSETVTTAHQSLATRLELISALLAASKGLRLDLVAAGAALRTYECAVDVIADGDGGTICAAGLRGRGPQGSHAVLATVTDVTWKPGKNPAEAVITWPPAEGATSYAVETTADTAATAGPFTAAGTGTHRRRVVTAPSPGAQLLVRVAAVDGDGASSAWSAPILVTTR